MILDSDQLQSYRAEGFYFPLRVLSADKARDYRDRFLAFEQSDIATSAQDLHNDIYLFKPHLVLTWVDALIHEPDLLDLAESLLGPDLMCWSAGIFQKPANSASFVSWHQDAVNFGLTPVDHVVRVWIALTETTLENGTLIYAKGAHREGLFRHDPTESASNLLTNNETARFESERHDQATVLLKEGEAAMHHLHTPHCSGPNASDTRRINVVVTFISPDVRQVHGPDSALLVRGRDRFGHFEHEKRPDADFSEPAKQRHHSAMRLRHGTFSEAARAYAASAH